MICINSGLIEERKTAKPDLSIFGWCYSELHKTKYKYFPFLIIDSIKLNFLLLLNSSELKEYDNFI